MPRRRRKPRWHRPPARGTVGAVFLFLALATSLLVTASAAEPAAEEPRGVRPGREIEIRGEVVEMSCYLRDGSRGEGHKACALSCLENGGQLGIVEDGTGRLYPLASAAPATDPSAAVREEIAEHVAVRGRLYERAESRVLVVEQLERLGN